MSYPNGPFETRKPRIGKTAYLFLISVAILLGLMTFFGERLGIADYLVDASEILAEVEEILFAEEPYILQEQNGTSGSEAASDNPWYRIYFTQPTCPPLEERHGGLETLIVDDLNGAQQRVDIAAFELNAEPIVDALIALEERSIPVRVVTDADYADESGIRRLRRNGISVIEDNRRALMHNKFIVIDDSILWTGSLNFTTNGLYCNNNNLVRFESDKLAENYITEMDEMYLNRSFGPDSANTTPHEEIGIDGVTVENYFAPEKKLVNAIARAVARAQDEILFMAFSFTNEDIGEAMLGRAEAGVVLNGIFEGLGANVQSSYYPIMSQSGIERLEVRIDANPYLMHHKVIIVDRRTTILGSFNFTGNANRQNDENLVIVHDEAFTQAFVQEFERRWTETASDQGFWNQLFE